MPLPEAIPVRYTEEEAGYVTVRPVVRQTFQLRELADMVLRVTGKDLTRVRQILRSGTLVYHSFRYWWQGFEPGAAELAALLAEFPEDDPSRRFDPAACVAVTFDAGTHLRPHSLEVSREMASRRPLLRRDSLWDTLMALAGASPPTYQAYSYEKHADLFRLTPPNGQASALIASLERCATREVRGALRGLPDVWTLVYVCLRR